MSSGLADLTDIVRDVRAASSLDEKLSILVRRIERSVAVDSCAVHLTGAEAGRYVLAASSESPPISASSAAVGADRLAALLRLVDERRELVVLANASADPRFGVAPLEDGSAGATFLGIPLIHDHHVLAILTAWKQSPVGFAGDEVTFFVTIAAQVARLVHEAAAADRVAWMLRGEESGDRFIEGVRAAPGLAIGTAWPLEPTDDLDAVPDRRSDDVEGEERVFRAAVAAARESLRAAGERPSTDLPREMRDLLAVHVALLADDGLVAEAIPRIRAGSAAASAWRDAIVAHAAVFDRMEDPYLRARGEDVRSIGRDVLLHLRSGRPQPGSHPERCVLVGETVSLSEIAAVPAGRLVGIVSLRGSPLSHTAVLAGALGIPAVVSLASLPLGRLEDSTIVVDGDEGRIHVRPAPATLASFERRLAEQRAFRGRLDVLRDQPAETPDGVRVALQANIGWGPDEIELARRSGAEGIGLFRTEYQFLMRDSFPVEDDQYRVYRPLLEAFPSAPVTIRTLDVGGDKILRYFPVEEDNPFLGRRGIRFSLEHPEIFLIQLRALLRANAGLGNLRVLFPMISRLGELEQALDLLGRAHRELLEEGRESAMPEVGAMIEVPSAVFLTGALAARVTFLSVGTNDLTQYLLAADRNDADVATPHDGFHPAVLDAVVRVIREAHERATPVTVCGEMAGDPAGALALLGMGVDALSMSPASLSRVKLVIRTFPAERARALVAEALRQSDGLPVHRLLTSAIEAAGIGSRAPAEPG